MICPYCKQDIPVSCDYCPECGARQMQKMKPKFGTGKIVACVLIGLLILSSLASAFTRNNASNTTTTKRASHTAQSAQKVTSPLDDDIIDVDINGCHVKYEGHEVVQNMSGDWCVAVYYTFTNNSDENEAFVFNVRDKAFQNGVELDSSLFHVNDYSKKRESELQPGVSTTVCSAFILQDDSNVELQVYPWISVNKSPTDAMLLSVKSNG